VLLLYSASNSIFLNHRFFFFLGIILSLYTVIGIWVVFVFWEIGVIRVNGIDFEEIKLDLSKRQHLSAEFKGTSIGYMIIENSWVCYILLTIYHR
jgi:hypothetical protein